MSGRPISKISLVVLCAISFSFVSLASQNSFAQDQENLESDFEMQEPAVVDEPVMDVPAPVPAKHNAVKNKKEAAKLAKKNSRAVKAAKHHKKEKKNIKERAKAKVAKKNKNKKKKS